jgi:hypothetical protein
MDKSLYKMKESKIIQLKNEVKVLTKTVKQLIQDFLKLDSLTRGTLSAFQFHIGEEEWNRILEELKNIEERSAAARGGINLKKSEKKFETDVE